jgi:alcohol dehydrogenase
MRPFEARLSSRVVFGPGTVSRLRALTRDLGSHHALLVADSGIVAAVSLLDDAGVAVCRFHDFGATPDSRMVEAGRVQAATAGGSSLDCAKGINFVLTNGGGMSDYRGYGKATRPMLPMIGVPTTAPGATDSRTR